MVLMFPLLTLNMSLLAEFGPLMEVLTISNYPQSNIPQTVYKFHKYWEIA